MRLAVADGCACLPGACNAQDAGAILEALCRDPVDFVRQGAYIGLALNYVGVPDAKAPGAAAARKLFELVSVVCV